MSDISLSDKEQKLFDFISTRTDVTVKKIEDILGENYVGALGRLLHLGIIKSEKRNMELGVVSKNTHGYTFKHKWTKCFFIEESK